MAKLIQTSWFGMSNKVWVTGLASFNGVNPNQYQQQILSSISTPELQIHKIKFVKDKVGDYTGKAIIEMETSAHANDLVKHHLKTFEMQIIEDDTKQVKENKENKINLKTRVYLTNLPSDVTQDDLYVMFNSVGLKTTELHIPLDIQGRSKPHALVFFKTEKDAKEAVKLLDSTLLHGQQIKVGSQLEEQRSRRDDDRLSQRFMQSKQTQSMNCLIDETPNEMIEELAEQATHWRSEKGLSQEEYNNLFSLLTPENHTLVNKYTQNMHTALAQERHVKHEIDESERKYPELHNYLKVEQQVMDALDIPVEERHRKLDSVKIPIARPMLSSVMRKRVKENIA